MKTKQYEKEFNSKRRFRYGVYRFFEAFGCIVLLIALIYFTVKNFEKVKENLANFIIGWVVVVCAIILEIRLIYSFVKDIKNPPKNEDSQKDQKLSETPMIRQAIYDAESKIFLEVIVDCYRICYRRLWHGNELVVNNCVYAEKKGIFEAVHTLRAVVDKHVIEAGLDEMNMIFIRFDGEVIDFEKRFL